MTTGRKLKIALVIFLVFFSGLALLPNFYSGLPEWWTKYCAPAGINLGLDLKGGLHVVLRVDQGPGKYAGFCGHGFQEPAGRKGHHRGAAGFRQGR